MYQVHLFYILEYGTYTFNTKQNNEGDSFRHLQFFVFEFHIHSKLVITIFFIRYLNLTEM